MTGDGIALPELGFESGTSTDGKVRLAGRYQLEERIAAGGMGVVWRATDLLLARTVAVKQLLLTPQLSEEAAEEARARATREARIAARLHHPAAITVFDIVTEDGNPWLVMEYLPSRSLAEVLAEGGGLPPQQVARIGAQLAAALAAAHAAGIVHRDVKPANVLLGEDGTVKITDFGVSRAAWDVAVTRTGMVAGTPAYLAPEVAQGKEPTEASDIFALGSTLYAAAEGEPPFGGGENSLAVLREVAEGAVRPPDRAGPLTGPLLALLSTDPAARPDADTATTMLAAVAAGETRTEGTTVPAIPVRGAPTRIVPPVDALTVRQRAASTPSWARSKPPRPRRRLLAAGLAAVLTALAAVVLVPMLSGSDDKPAATTAETVSYATPPATPAEAQGAVRSFFAVLPDDTETAWSYLGESARAQAGGFGTFERSWSTVSYVNPTGEMTVDGYHVRLEVLFERTDGTATIEPYQVDVRSNPQGRPIIESVAPTGPGRPTDFADRGDTTAPSDDVNVVPETRAVTPEPVPEPITPTPTTTTAPPAPDTPTASAEPEPSSGQTPPDGEQVVPESSAELP